MKNYILYDADGEIKRHGSCENNDFAIQSMEGCTLMENPSNTVNPQVSYILAGAVTDYTPEQAAAKALRPLHSSTWSNATMAWVDTRTEEQVTEELASSVRSQRDALLLASDWTQLSDAPLTPEEQAAWATYRQALRDVPDQPGFPSEVTWPTAP